MRHRTISYLGLSFILSIILSFGSYSQSPAVGRIDSILNQRLEDKSKQKESGTFVGKFKAYKKVLGLLKVRTEKGEIYHEYIIYDNKILKHREVQIIEKHYGNDFQSEEYFYVDNKLVKYQRTIDKRTKKGTYPKDKTTFYVDVDNNKVISLDSKVESWTLKSLQEQEKKDTEMKWD